MAGAIISLPYEITYPEKYIIIIYLTKSYYNGFEWLEGISPRIVYWCSVPQGNDLDDSVFRFPAALPHSGNSMTHQWSESVYPFLCEQL